jgi:hypothetical protein
MDVAEGEGGDEGLELVLAVLLHFKFLLLGCQLKRQNIR